MRAEKEALRILRNRSADLEMTMAKQLKERENTVVTMEERAKTLISTRAESEYRHKLVIDKQAEIVELKKVIDQVEKERDSAECKRKNLEEGNKVLAVARN